MKNLYMSIFSSEKTPHKPESQRAGVSCWLNYKAKTQSQGFSFQCTAKLLKGKSETRYQGAILAVQGPEIQRDLLPGSDLFLGPHS